MLDINNCKIMKQGVLLYDNTLEYRVVIIESDLLHGTGDFDDPPELAEDRDGPCYYAWCDSPSSPNAFCSGWPNAFLSVKEAMEAIEKEPYFSHWIDPEKEGGPNRLEFGEVR